MFVKLVATILMIGAAILLGCEGDAGPVGPAGPAGPPGPGMILAFGDVDFTVGVGNDDIISFGPSSRVDSVTVDDSGGDGVFLVSCFGTFPPTEGTLIVSSSSTQSVANNITTTATISSWTTTTIVFNAQTFNTDTAVLDGDDFSFVIFGE